MDPPKDCGCSLIVRADCRSSRTAAPAATSPQAALPTGPADPKVCNVLSLALGCGACYRTIAEVCILHMVSLRDTTSLQGCHKRAACGVGKISWLARQVDKLACRVATIISWHAVYQNDEFAIGVHVTPSDADTGVSVSQALTVWTSHICRLLIDEGVLRFCFSPAQRKYVLKSKHSKPP